MNDSRYRNRLIPTGRPRRDSTRREYDETCPRVIVGVMKKTKKEKRDDRASDLYGHDEYIVCFRSARDPAGFDEIKVCFKRSKRYFVFIVRVHVVTHFDG